MNAVPVLAFLTALSLAAAPALLEVSVPELRFRVVGLATRAELQAGTVETAPVLRARYAERCVVEHVEPATCLKDLAASVKARGGTMDPVRLRLADALLQRGKWGAALAVLARLEGPVSAVRRQMEARALTWSAGPGPAADAWIDAVVRSSLQERAAVVNEAYDVGMRWADAARVTNTPQTVSAARKLLRALVPQLEPRRASLARAAVELMDQPLDADVPLARLQALAEGTLAAHRVVVRGCLERPGVVGADLLDLHLEVDRRGRVSRVDGAPNACVKTSVQALTFVTDRPMRVHAQLRLEAVR